MSYKVGYQYLLFHTGICVALGTLTSLEKAPEGHSFFFLAVQGVRGKLDMDRHYWGAEATTPKESCPCSWLSFHILQHSLLYCSFFHCFWVRTEASPISGRQLESDLWHNHWFYYRAECENRCCGFVVSRRLPYIIARLSNTSAKNRFFSLKAIVEGSCELSAAVFVRAWAELGGPMERARAPPHTFLLNPSQPVSAHLIHVCVWVIHTHRIRPYFNAVMCPVQQNCLSVCLTSCS